MKIIKCLCLWIMLLGYAKLPAQTCSPYVGGYIPSYRDPATVDYTKLTHVFYAFAVTNASGEIILDNPGVFSTFKTASSGKQRYLSLGGGGDNTLAAMATSATARQTFVNNCVSFCQTHELHGIDMDWEGIRTTQDSTNYGALMRELKSELHANGLQLIATIGYGSYSGDYYNVGALKAADWIQLMVYDQTGTWAESPYGNHATYQHMLDAITYWTGRGYNDLSMIVIGLPFYGYKFNSTQGGLATALTYSEIVNTHPDLSCDWDEVGLTVFNSPETIRKKVRYVIDNGLKGVMIWEMGQDIISSNDKSLLKAVSLASCDLPAACSTFITGVNENPEGSIQFFPNPTCAVIHISFGSFDHDIDKIEFIDGIGQLISHQEKPFSTESSVINFAGVSPGIYYLRITMGSGKAMVKRVVKI